MRGKPSEDYVRFVCFRMVDGQRSRLGLFHALDDARDSDLAPDWALEQLRDLRLWFNDNLEAPDRFDRGSRRGGDQQALSWFKTGADDSVSDEGKTQNRRVVVKVLTSKSVAGL